MASKQSAQSTEGRGFLHEVEKTASAIIDDVKQLFESLSGKVSELAGSAADATVSMAEKVGAEPAELLKGLLQDVKEVGEASITTIGEKFDGLKDYVIRSAPEAPVATGKKAAKKAARKKQAAKQAGIKKTASKKKAAAKKRTAKQKQAVVKKPAAKKKAGVKKKVGKKKAAKKKVAVKKS